MRNQTNAVTIQFYDELGELRKTRTVNELYNHMHIGSLTYTALFSDPDTAHCPYRGGRMEIFSAEVPL